MYKNIQLENKGALSSQSLESLGQIMVVCGKNNSGKSTLLLAISEGKHYLKRNEFNSHSLGQCFRYRDGERLEVGYQIIEKVLKTKDIWMQLDINSLQQLLANELSTWHLQRPAILDQNAFSNLYDISLPSQNVVFIPPKRVLQLKNEVTGTIVVKEDGTGLLNYLFYACNQFENDLDRRIHEEIKQLFTNVSGGYDFKITNNAANQINLFFREGKYPWVSAAACGLGLQDLLILLYFIVSKQYDTIIVEEPESHLHPSMQRKLLQVCKARTQKQFFFSTHSSVFLDLTLVDKIFHTEMVGGAIKVSDDTSRAVVLDSLGYSVTDNLVSDLIILVEGPSDKPVLEEFLRQLGLYTSYNIKIWPLGGDIMDQCDLSVFAEEYKIISLIDKDPGSKKVRTRFTTNCKSLGIEVFKLKRRAIENYFTVNALKSVFKGQIPDTFTEVDPETTLESQLGMNVKKSNFQIAKEMTLQDIEGTDLYAFLERVEHKLKH